MTPFINAATGLLVDGLHRLICSQEELSASAAVSTSFAAFQETCTISPSIVGYVEARIAKAGNKTAFTPKQLELMMLGMIARSSSTYGTIPGVVAHLALIGEHSDAAILNENAKNETGDRAHIPHPSLLYDCFAVVAPAFSISALTPARYHILRLVLLTRQQGAAELRTIADVQAYVDKAELHAPDHDEEDIGIALHYADTYGPELNQLHSRVIEAETRLDEAGGNVSARNPYDRRWLAIRCLELAMREASSVDEPETKRFSYIGAWGQVVEHLAPILPTADLPRARAWTEAHNDEAAGQAVGWEGAAEEGHAEDAWEQALKVMSKLTPATFSAVLDEVTKLNELRLRFWEEVVARLRAIDIIEGRDQTMVAAQ